MSFQKLQHIYVGYPRPYATDPFAERLARDLIAHGFDAWTPSLSTEESWLDKDLEWQGMVLTARLHVLLCAKSAESADQVPIALEYGITPIVALRQEECIPSLRSARQIDFRNGYDAGLDALDLALREELAKPDTRHHRDYGDDR